MNQIAKYLVVRILFLLFLLLCTGYFYEKLIYPEVYKKEAWIAELCDVQMSKNPKILFFSASPNKACADSDTDLRSISQFTSKHIGRTIHSMDEAAFHAGIFANILKRLPDSNQVQTVIMDLNVRSFGVRWIHSPLENSLQKSIAHWNSRPGLVNRINISLKNYNYISKNERIAQIEYHDKFEPILLGEKTSTVHNWSKKLDAENSIMMVEKFGFNINEKNCRLAQYDEVVAICKKKKINLIFVILPEDLQSMKQSVSKDLADITVENASFLSNRYKKQGAFVINLCSSLNQDRFFENFPTEHYDQVGRDFVAQQIASVYSKNRLTFEK